MPVLGRPPESGLAHSTQTQTQYTPIQQPPQPPKPQYRYEMRPGFMLVIDVQTGAVVGRVPLQRSTEILPTPTIEPPLEYLEALQKGEISKPKLPQGAVITGYTKTETGWTISYLTEAPYRVTYSLPTGTDISPYITGYIQPETVTPPTQELVLPSGVTHRLERMSQQQTERERSQAIDRMIMGAVPKGATITSITPTEKGYTIQYTQPGKPSPTIWETWFGSMTPTQAIERVGSDLTFRQIWDPAYYKRIEQQYKEWKATKTYTELAQIKQARAQQLEIGASALMLGVAAYDIGRAVYTIAKYHSTWKEPLTAEGLYGIDEEKAMQILNVSGPKGDRISQPTTITPTEKPIADTFTITPTRGITTTPMKTTLEKTMKDTKGMATFASLILLPTIAEVGTIEVPLGMYYPQYISELAFAGISVGTFFTVASAAKTMAGQTLVSLAKPKPLEKQIQAPRTPTRLSFMETLTPQTMTSTRAVETTTTELAQTQTQGMKTIQRQAQVQKQLQVQVTKQFEVPDFYLKKGKKRRDFLGLDLIGRYGRINPILGPKETLKKMFQ